MTVRAGTWSTNIFRDATLTVKDGVVDSEFPLENLRDSDPTEACKSTTDEFMFAMDFGSAVHLSWAALINHNLATAAGVKLRGYTSAPTDETTTPQIEISPKSAVAALDSNSFRNNIWFDVDAVSSVASYRYWALVVPAGGSTIFIGGEFWADTASRAQIGILQGSARGPLYVTIRNVTYGGVSLKAKRGTRQEAFECQALGTLAQITVIRDWYEAAFGGAENMIFIPDDSEGVVYLVEPVDDSLRIEHVDGDVYRLKYQLRELSRGLSWD